MMVAGCGSSAEQVTSAQAALAPVHTQVEALPSVVSADVDVEYITGVRFADVAVVRVTSTAADAGGLTAVAEEAARLVWNSQMPDVSAVHVSVHPEDRDLEDEAGGRLEVSFRMTGDELEGVFGQRGSGAPG